MRYIVAATGGLEQPSFFSSTDPLVARNEFDAWSEELVNEPGDRVDLLVIEDAGYIRTIDTTTYEG